jgi:hypothetical protein
LDPYRDNREALRARAVELDRLIGERRAELAALRFARAISALKWLAPAALLLAFTGATLARRSAPRPSPQSPEKWQARVVASNHPAVHSGGSCQVELTTSCTASVVCGLYSYHGTGRCERGHYHDESDTSTDGNPQCEIVGGHVMMREFVRWASDQTRHQVWSIELERE